MRSVQSTLALIEGDVAGAEFPPMRWFLTLCLSLVLTYFCLLNGTNKVTNVISVDAHNTYVSNFDNKWAPLWSALTDHEIDGNHFRVGVGAAQIVSGLLLWTSWAGFGNFVLLVVYALVGVSKHIVNEGFYNISGLLFACAFVRLIIAPTQTRANGRAKGKSKNKRS